MEEDDFINIRPPQATISADKSHRPRNSNSKRDRQVFVSSRRDERSHDHHRNRHGHGDSRRRSGLDLRDRLNNRNQGPRRRPKDHHRNRDNKQGGRPQHSMPQQSRSSHKERTENESSSRERDLRLQRLINASAAKAESKRDIEMKREKAAREKR